MRDGDVTGLLLAWQQGNEDALDALIPAVYDELRRLAHRHLRDRLSRHEFQTTALVHEAYLRLLGTRQIDWQGRAHFFALFAQVMRRVLVDAVRASHAQKRGGLVHHVALPDGEPAAAGPSRDLVAVDDALTALAAVEPRKAKVVELRYFGGLTAEESARALGVSHATVERDWRLAKLWLARELAGRSV